MKYKDNATLGVAKLDYFIASGVKQKNIQDQLNLESFLGLNDITPMQTSYTQTAEDRMEEPSGKQGNQSDDIEPSSEKEPNTEKQEDELNEKTSD